MTIYPQFLLNFFSNLNFNMKEVLKFYNINYPIILNILMKFQPLLVLFILPCFIIVIFYFSLLIIYIYRLKDIIFNNIGNNLFTENSLRNILCQIWYAKSRILHGYEIVGLEKIPLNESAYIVYFHGTLPLDIYYFATNFILKRKKIPICVVDRFLFHLPGFRTLLDFMHATPGSIEGCVKLLSETNEVLLLSPGGVREALFSDQNYNILWGKRLGFAKIALLAKKPVYPMFTENIREPIRVLQLGKSFWANLYEKTRIPLVFLYGYFPSKLRTYVGDPIYPYENEDAESFADRVKKSIEELIHEKQILPGNIVRSVAQRFPYFDKWFHNYYQSKRPPIKSKTK